MHSAPAASPFFLSAQIIPQHRILTQLSPHLLNVLPENPGAAWGPPLLLRKYRGVGNDKTSAWGGAPGQKGESRRRKADGKGYTKASQRETERSTTRAVGQGHSHQAQVMHSQAFALGCTRIFRVLQR